MYSGFITSRHTVNWLGAHQKFNKAAYRQLLPFVDMERFPVLDKIQHFEGYNGPDGIKVKTTLRRDEPTHFYDPENETGPLLEYIENHYFSLVEALKTGNGIRAAFEAAWLAHTITDGLTPAHHFPYQDKLHELYSCCNQNFHKRRHKIILKGETRRQSLRHNWRLWGGKGLLSSHIHFEFGVAAAVITGKFHTNINPAKLKEARSLGAIEFFKAEARQIDQLKMYEQFRKFSWTVSLARTARHRLAPMIIQAVAIEWILAAEAAGTAKPNDLALAVALQSSPYQQPGLAGSSVNIEA